MNTMEKAAVRSVAAGLAAWVLAGSIPAEAIDLRSWDQKIANPVTRFVVLRAFDDQAVLDRETQLVWQTSPSTEEVN